MKKTFRISKRRGVTDIISTMLLMAITVAGASTLTYFVNDSFISGQLSTASSLDTGTKSVQLLAYDTRDSANLLQVTNLNNKFGDQKLCGVSCSGGGLINKIPINGGTEFVMIKIKNSGINSIFLENIKLNNVVHEWDSQTSGIALSPLQDLSSGGSYPHDGTFSILSESSIIQSTSNEIQNGNTVNLLIKLGPEDDDILLNKGIRVLLNIGNLNPVEFFIESGGAQ